MDKPTKTFGMKTPTDLYRKLLFDIERLREAPASAKAQYAAFDAAVDASHLVEWVLHSCSAEAHVRLTGVERGKDGALKGFGKINKARLPALEFCRQIANSVKHVIVTKGPIMHNLSTGSSVKFDPPFVADQPFPPGFKLLPWVYVVLDDKEHEAIELFEAMASQWNIFLRQEGLFIEEIPDQYDQDFDEQNG